MNQPQCDINQSINPSSLEQHKQSFYDAILNDDIDSIRSFLNNPTTTSLYHQFKYPVERDYIPFNSQVSPITIAALNNKLSILQLLIQHVESLTQTSYDPIQNIEHQIPLFHYAVTTGNHEMMNYVLSLYPPSQQIDDITGRYVPNPLHFAVTYLPLETVQYLIQHYNFNLLHQDEMLSNILHFVTFSKQDSIPKFDYLITLDGVSNLLENPDSNGLTPLLSCADRNHSPQLFQHIYTYYNAQLRCPGYKTSVAHCFARRGNIDMIDYIARIDPTLILEEDRYGYTPLLNAIVNNQLPMVKHLIEKYNVDIQHRVTHGLTPIHLSMKNGSIELIDYIISCDQSLIESVDDFKRTPIAFACQYARVPIVQHLLHRHGANPFTLEKSSLSTVNLLHRAVSSKNVDLIELILKVFETSTYIPPTNHIIPNDLSIPSYPRLTGEWFNNVDSPLHKAIHEFKLIPLKLLIRSKANITITNRIADVGKTSITILQYAYDCASHNGNKTFIFKYLLSNECLEDWNSNELKFHDDETVQVYGQKDPIHAQLDIPFKGTSNTILLRTAFHEQFDLMKLLIERNANIYAVDDQQNNILHLMIPSRPSWRELRINDIHNFLHYLFSLPTIDIPQLLSQKSDIDHCTPLFQAASQFPFYIIQQLINAKADVNDILPTAETLLHHAASNERHSIINQLLQHYPEQLQSQLYQHDFDGGLPFHRAVATIKPFEQVYNDSDDDSDDTLIKVNPDIQSFIQHDPTLLIQTTLSNETILHIAVSIGVYDGDNEDANPTYNSPTLLTFLIESMIENAQHVL